MIPLKPGLDRKERSNAGSQSRWYAFGSWMRSKYASTCSPVRAEEMDVILILYAIKSGQVSISVPQKEAIYV